MRSGLTEAKERDAQIWIWGQIPWLIQLCSRLRARETGSEMPWREWSKIVFAGWGMCGWRGGRVDPLQRRGDEKRPRRKCGCGVCNVCVRPHACCVSACVCVHPHAPYFVYFSCKYGRDWDKFKYWQKGDSRGKMWSHRLGDEGLGEGNLGEQLQREIDFGKMEGRLQRVHFNLIDSLATIINSEICINTKLF